MAMPSGGERGVVLISGASSGIGLATALALRRGGFTVLAGVRSPEGRDALDAVADAALVPVSLDVRDPDAVESAVARAEAVAGARGLTGLVNNAGISTLGPVEALTVDALRELFEVNVVGAVRLTRACLPALRAARGRVVNVSSIAGLSALPFMGGYSASKHALEALSDALRVELAPWSIGVAIVEPGTIDTPIAGKALASMDALDRSHPGLAGLYADGLRAFRRKVADAASQALPPSRAADAIVHALTARRPRTRYVVGSEAWRRLLLRRVLPDRWHDLAVRLVVGLPGPGWASSDRAAASGEAASPHGRPGTARR
jgi:NAD(P)-dependent dehydrogenase (short-subunit alcohol dehydrogenase family)